MMERIGGHLSYLSECSSAAFQDSEKIQEVRMQSMEFNLSCYIRYSQYATIS